MPTPIRCILAEQNGTGGGGGTVTLSKIEITTPPKKTTYIAGEKFDPTGMVVEATYSIGSVPIATTEIVGYGYPTDPLEDGTTEIYITYSEGGINCRVRQAVTITHGVRAIEITTQPTKKTYEYGDTLNMDGAVITATYSDGATATIPVANCDYSPKTLSTVTNAQTITVVYSENGLTREATFTVVVNKNL